MNNPDTVIALLEGDGFDAVTRRTLSLIISFPEKKDPATEMIEIFCKSCTDMSLPPATPEKIASITHAVITAYPEQYDLAIQGIQHTLGSMASDDARAPAAIQGTCVGLMEAFPGFEKNMGNKDLATYVLLFANFMLLIITGSSKQGTMSREFSGRMANAAARFVHSMTNRSRAIQPESSPWKRLTLMFFDKLSPLMDMPPPKEGDIPALVWTVKELTLRMFLSSSMATRIKFAQTCPIE